MRSKTLNSVYLFFLLIIFYLSAYLIIKYFGFKLGGDSQRYIRYSNNLNELFLSFKAFCSSSYVFILFLIRKLEISINTIYFIQILTHSIAGCLIYFYFYQKEFDIIICIIITGLYLFYPPLLVWDFYLLTDSLNVHLSFITLFLLFFFKKKYLFLILILILYSSLIRAHSIFLLFTCIIYFFNRNFSSINKKYFYLILSILLLIFIFILNSYSGWLINYISNSYISGKFIWGDNIFGISGIDSQNQITNLFDLLKLMFLNPIYSLEYIIKKFFFFIFGVRPGYSLLHNLFLYITISLLLVSSVFEIFHRFYNKLWEDNFFNFLLIYVCFYLLASLVCFLDPDARFVLPIYPFMIVCSGFFLNRLYVRVKYKVISR